MRYVEFTLLFIALSACGGQSSQSVSAPPAGTVAPPPAAGAVTPSSVAPVQAQVDASKHYDKFLSEGVPQKPLDEVIAYFHANQSTFENKEVVAIADYSADSRSKRFYLLDLSSGEVRKEVVAHGSGKSKSRPGVRHGDPNHDGILDKCVHDEPSCCSMTPTSPGYQESAFKECLKANSCRDGMTRLGFMKVTMPHVYVPRPADRYRSVGFPAFDDKGNNAVAIEGLDWRNFAASDDGVVFHEMWYVRGEGSVQGRSYGTLAFQIGKGAPLFKRMAGGSLFYGYAPQCE